MAVPAANGIGVACPVCTMAALPYKNGTVRGHSPLSEQRTIPSLIQRLQSENRELRAELAEARAGSQDTRDRESRSPDGDGLLTKSVVTGAADAPSAGVQETVPRPKAFAHSHAGEARKSYREQNAPAGSEPADSHQLRAQLAAESRAGSVLREHLERLNKAMLETPAFRLLDGKFYRAVPIDMANDLSTVLAETSTELADTPDRQK